MNFKIIDFNKDLGQVIVRFEGYEPVTLTLPIEGGKYLIGEHLETYIESFRPFVDVSREQLLKEVSNHSDIENLVEVEEVDIETLKKQIREQRNKLLFMSDYTQLADAGLRQDQKDAFATYRQLLRDIPDQLDFPYNVTFNKAPSFPSELITPVVTIG